MFRRRVFPARQCYDLSASHGLALIKRDRHKESTAEIKRHGFDLKLTRKDGLLEELKGHRFFFMR